MSLPRELLHPALRGLSDWEITRRSNWLLSLFVSGDKRISWYGNLVREDGGNGMYATRPLADAWPHKVVESSTIGPQ